MPTLRGYSQSQKASGPMPVDGTGTEELIAISSEMELFKDWPGYVMKQERGLRRAIFYVKEKKKKSFRKGRPILFYFLKILFIFF